MADDKLFSDFPSADKQQWIAAVSKGLQGKSLDSFTTQLSDGIAIQPFYTAEDTLSIPPLSIQHTGKRNWVNYVIIEVKDISLVNELIKRKIKTGADGFLLQIDSIRPIDFFLLLKDIDVTSISLSFQVPEISISFIDLYFGYLDKIKIDKKEIKGFIQIDSLAEASRELIAKQISITQEARNFKSLLIQTPSSSDKIFSEAINFLFSLIDELKAFNISAEMIAKSAAFSYSLSNAYFVEIAKLRAFKLILQSALHSLQVTDYNIPVICSTSVSSSTDLVEKNILRNTTQAMSGILGGCDAIIIQPHDGLHNEFSERIANNISNLFN